MWPHMYIHAYMTCRVEKTYIYSNNLFIFFSPSLLHSHVVLHPVGLVLIAL